MYRLAKYLILIAVANKGVSFEDPSSLEDQSFWAYHIVRAYHQLIIDKKNQSLMNHQSIIDQSSINQSSINNRWEINQQSISNQSSVNHQSISDQSPFY